MEGRREEPQVCLITGRTGTKLGCERERQGVWRSAMLSVLAWSGCCYLGQQTLGPPSLEQRVGVYINLFVFSSQCWEVTVMPPGVSCFLCLMLADVGWLRACSILCPDAEVELNPLKTRCQY